MLRPRNFTVVMTTGEEQIVLIDFAMTAQEIINNLLNSKNRNDLVLCYQSNDQGK